MAASHNNEYASFKEGDSLSEAEKHGWMVARLLARKFCDLTLSIILEIF